MNRLVLAAFAASLVACSDTPAGSGDASVCVEERRDIPVSINRDLDILLVVDPSPSMAGESETWSTAIAQFANVLENIEGGLPNVHIGVVSADAAARGGQLEASPRIADCTPPDGNYIEDIAYANGERDANYTGTLADTLACIASLPPTGNTIEQPLEALVRAVDGSNPGNDGFLRDTAYLFVVLVGDEDDCSGGAAFELGEAEDRSAWRCFADGVACDQDASAVGTKTGCAAVDSPSTLGPVEGYVQALKAVKSDPSLVLVAAIADAGDAVVELTNDGPVLSPSCSTATAEGFPAFRTGAFLDRFPQRSSLTDVCADDWTDAMLLVAESLVSTLIGIPCFGDSIDLDPDTAGVQHECQVSEIRFAGTDQQEETLLPECSAADPPDDERPCWWIDAHPWCDAGDPYGFEVFRGRETLINNVRISVRCHAGC